MKSRKFITQIESMKGCENDLTKMIEKHALQECIWHVLLKLDEDIKNIKSLKKKCLYESTKHTNSTRSKE